MGKPINLNSQLSYQAIIKNIGQRGVLRVDSTYERNGIKHVILHERTAKEWLMEKLNPAKARASREKVEAALISLVEATARRPEQLVQNIRDRTQHGVDITGRAIKRDHQRVEAHQNPLPLKGGTVAARGTGNSVQIIAASAIKVRCDHAILRDSTALSDISVRTDLLEAYESLRRWQEPVTNSIRGGKSVNPAACVSQRIEVGLAAKSWTCIADPVLPPTGSGEIKLAESNLEQMIRAALDGAKGSVVIEPIPDKLVEKNGKSVRTYSEEGLRAQLLAAGEAVKSAKNAKVSLVVSFACEDKEVLNKLKNLKTKKPLDQLA